MMIRQSKFIGNDERWYVTVLHVCVQQQWCVSSL